MKARQETALGADAGFIARNVELQLSIAKFQNNGGEYGVALAILNAAYGRGGEGHTGIADAGRARHVDASSSHDGGAGRVEGADKADHTMPVPPSAGRSGEGQTEFAGNAEPSMPSSASTRNKPGHARRGAAAIASAQSTMAKSLFDTTILPDGRRLREVRWSECPALSSRYRHLSRVLMAIHNVGTPSHPDDKLDAVVNDAGLAEIVAAVEKFNDIQ
jgi:hypothetical protein